MKLRVVHTTQYQYSEPVTLSHNQIRLTPREYAYQHCLQSRINIEPFSTELQSWMDPFGNEVTYFTFENPHSELIISLEAEVELLPREESPLLGAITWEQAVKALRSPKNADTLEAALFCYPSPYISFDPAVTEYAQASFAPERSLREVVAELMRRIHQDFRYDPQATNLNTTLPELLQLRRGVCQDFAHLQIACLRTFGLAARYVSGYLMTRPPPGKPKLVGADASHAWLAVYFPGVGWIDYDPTNNCLPGEEHITLAWGRDYFDVAPIKGLYLGGGGANTLQVSVDVRV
jgi:transglutaminase-like putative cysteine protease